MSAQSFSLYRPLDPSTLEFRIGDFIWFTKNLVKLNEMFSTRFDRCVLELVPDALPNPIVFSMKINTDRAGDRLYALADNGIDPTETSFAEYSFLLCLGDDVEALERAHLQELLYEGSRTSMPSNPTYASASLNLDYVEI